MPWWALGYVALWVVSLGGNLVYRRRMQCSLPRLAAISVSGATAVFFVFAFWHPEMSDRISRFLPMMLAYMLATDVSMMMWFVPVLQREMEAGMEEGLDSVEEDPETEEFVRMSMRALAWVALSLGIFVVLLFLLPAYVLAVMVCLR